MRPAKLPTGASSETLLTLKQVGARLGVSAVTAWRRVRAGHIPAIDIGDRRPALRVDSADLDAYLRDRKLRLPHRPS